MRGASGRSQRRRFAALALAACSCALLPIAHASEGTTAAATAASAPAAAVAGTPAAKATPADILHRAFQNRYALSFTSEIELILQVDGKEVRRRSLQAATLEGDGDYRAIGQVLQPEYLRGMTLLSVSEDAGGHQAFVYLPAMKRIRRIAFTHRDDPFLGSDLTYEDFERRRTSDYEVESMREGFAGEGVGNAASEGDAAPTRGEPVWFVTCHPTAALRYQRAEFAIARSDYAILGIIEYKDGREEPFRRMVAPRAGMTDLDGHVIATRMRFENLERNTATDVAFSQLQARKLDKRLFTSGALERQASVRKALECSGEGCD